MTMNTRFIDAEAKMRSDQEGLDIYMAAIEAVYNARLDGQSSGKHSPESWQEENIENQVTHASDHAYNFLSMFQEPEHYPFNLKEAEHALCRLAIAIALYKRQEKN